ncbi:MAG: hypothetical protein II874_08185 [Bacteroidales bacterium]|nr:hypothetical protein [Bacteroidales bacterium]
MKRSILLYMSLALAAALALSCKKDEEKTTTLPYLYGVDFDLPVFARPGDSFTLTPYGVYYTEGEGVEKYNYKWKINTDSYSDPMDTFTFTANEVGNYTIYCQASDPDGKYYSVATSKLLIVIDPALGKTLTGTGISASDDHIADSRDKAGENEYFYIRKGNLDWFRNNLAWTGAGVAYENSDVTSYPLGRYYTWDEAMTACPAGWRLPTDEEWESLGNDAGALSADAYLNSHRMWEYWPDVARTNDTKMSVIPSGYTLVGKDAPTFKRLYDYAAFWTATESADDPSVARYRYIYVEENDVKATYGDKSSLALSVRCVR